MSSVAGAQALAAQVLAREPRLDLLVNNAGAAWGAAFDGFPASGWDKVTDLNTSASRDKAVAVAFAPATSAQP